MLLVNFLGEPGAGKTTATAGLFYELKTTGFDVEMVTEYSKELLIAGDTATLSDELQVFAEKYRRIKRMEDVDIVLTDSPLINSIVYGGEQFGGEGPDFYRRVASRFDSIFVIVRRTEPYVPVARLPDAESARAAGDRLIAEIELLDPPRISVTGVRENLGRIADFVRQHAASRGIRPLVSGDEVDLAGRDFRRN